MLALSNADGVSSPFAIEASACECYALVTEAFGTLALVTTAADRPFDTTPTRLTVAA
jgi:hypothetical protein